MEVRGAHYCRRERCIHEGVRRSLARVGVRRAGHVIAGLCCAIVKKKRDEKEEIADEEKEEEEEMHRDSCLTRFYERALLTVIMRGGRAFLRRRSREGHTSGGPRGYTFMHFYVYIRKNWRYIVLVETLNNCNKISFVINRKFYSLKFNSRRSHYQVLLWKIARSQIKLIYC